MKTPQEFFIDWEAWAFGFGYGTGEAHVLEALKTFFTVVPECECYDYRDLEIALTPTVAWLLINFAARAKLIEYGTSPRHGWLTDQGRALQDFLRLHSVEQLYEIATSIEGMERDGKFYIHCTPELCQCYTMDRVVRCENPFWGVRGKRGSVS